MKLSEIAFPVYRLQKAKPSTIEGVTFYLKVDREGNDIPEIIDDKNIKESSLARRRLHIKKPYPIREAIFFYGDLLKLGVKDAWFIDHLGKLFTLGKTRKVPLICRKITNIKKEIGATLVEIEGLPGRYMSLFPPESNEGYALMLKISVHSYLLYGFSQEKITDTYRKI
jgi:hypothetical protein